MCPFSFRLSYLLLIRHIYLLSRYGSFKSLSYWCLGDSLVFFNFRKFIPVYAYISPECDYFHSRRLYMVWSVILHSWIFCWCLCSRVFCLSSCASSCLECSWNQDLATIPNLTTISPLLSQPTLSFMSHGYNNCIGPWGCLLYSRTSVSYSVDVYSHMSCLSFLFNAKYFLFAQIFIFGHFLRILP